MRNANISNKPNRRGGRFYKIRVKLVSLRNRISSIIDSIRNSRKPGEMWSDAVYWIKRYIYLGVLMINDLRRGFNLMSGLANNYMNSLSRIIRNMVNASTRFMLILRNLPTAIVGAFRRLLIRLSSPKYGEYSSTIRTVLTILSIVILIVIIISIIMLL